MDMDDEVYNRLRRELEREHELRLQALDHVWMRLCGGRADSEVDFQLKPPSVASKRGALLAAVRSVVDEFEGEFDINDVQEAIRRSRPDVPQPTNPTSVSGTLRKLYSDDIIELTTAGHGPHPAKYRKARDEAPRRRRGDRSGSRTPAN